MHFVCVWEAKLNVRRVNTTFFLENCSQILTVFTGLSADAFHLILRMMHDVYFFGRYQLLAVEHFDFYD